MAGQRAMRRKAPPGADLRHYDLVSGRFVCNEAHPWSGKREDAPNGVRHERATETDGAWSCPDCGAEWRTS